LDDEAVTAGAAAVDDDIGGGAGDAKLFGAMVGAPLVDVVEPLSTTLPVAFTVGAGAIVGSNADGRAPTADAAEGGAIELVMRGY